MQVIQQARSLKVLVVGDSCTDRFVYGTCDRLSPEAPVPILNHVETKEMPGMAGNVVENVSAFTDDITVLTQETESIKTRYVDIKSNQHIMRYDSYIDTTRNFDIFNISNSLEANNAILGKYNVVIISDYNKGYMSDEQISLFTNKLNQLIYVDSKRSDVSCFKNSIIKLNQKEFKISNGTLDKSSKIVKTLGHNGASFNGSIYPAQRVEVFDVSGAGDTFLSSFSIFHAVTGDFIGAIKFANKCASIAVQKKGTYALNKRDLREK